MHLEVDLNWLKEHLVELLNTPSPTGLSHHAVDKVAGWLKELGLESRRTPKGALLWTLPGQNEGGRAISSHIDTLGAMVKDIKTNGRPSLSMLGGYDWATIEGAYCKVHTQSGEVFTATVVNTKQSSHVHGPALRDLKRSQENLELRLDAPVNSAEDSRALGIEVGDFVSLDPRVELTGNGYIKSRHLDNKISVAICLAATKALLDADIKPAFSSHFFISNYEEVGHGAATGIPVDCLEHLCLDMAVVGEGQTGSEHHVSLCVKDSSGPYDYAMNSRLRQLAQAQDIPLKIDIYPYYASDASAAWRSGGNYPAALIGPGVDASHAYERCHDEGVLATCKLLLAYLQTE